MGIDFASNYFNLENIPTNSAAQTVLVSLSKGI